MTRQQDTNSQDSKKTRARQVMQVGADAMIKDGTPVEEQREMPGRGGVEFGAEDLERALGDAMRASSAFARAAPDAAAEAPEDGGADEQEDGGAPAPGDAKTELETLREERDMYLDLARRERADFDNYRKRMQRETAERKRASLADFLKDFFGPLDDMDRVLRESAKNHSFDALVQGVRIMEENFWRALAKAGVRRIDAMGKPFDPNLHEAMAAMPSAEVPPNTVIEVYDNGYKLDEFILRPAKVIVSRAPDAE